MRDQQSGCPTRTRARYRNLSRKPERLDDGILQAQSPASFPGCRKLCIVESGASSGDRSIVVRPVVRGEGYADSRAVGLGSAVEPRRGPGLARRGRDRRDSLHIVGHPGPVA